jgi:hypothetical protein
MPWGAKIDSAPLADFGQEIFFPDMPTLNSPSHVAQCQVTVGFTPTNGPSENAIISVYGTLDDDGEPNWDVQPLPGLSFTLSQDDNPNSITFTVSGVRRFRVGVRAERRGAVLDSANFSYRIGTPEVVGLAAG